MMSTEVQRLFDIASAAEYLRGIGATAATKNFIRRLINSGQIPHLRIGKKFYCTRESLDVWIARKLPHGSKVRKCL